MYSGGRVGVVRLLNPSTAVGSEIALALERFGSSEVRYGVELLEGKGDFELKLIY